MNGLILFFVDPVLFFQLIDILFVMVQDFPGLLQVQLDRPYDLPDILFTACLFQSLFIGYESLLPPRESTTTSPTERECPVKSSGLLRLKRS